jgi:excisionase family DNA binding protein
MFMVNYETLMTIDELSAYLKVTKRTIYEWLKLHKVPAVKLVGQWRFRKNRIDDWIEKQEDIRWSNIH